jgi:hypothetical protein
MCDFVKECCVVRTTLVLPDIFGFLDGTEFNDPAVIKTPEFQCSVIPALIVKKLHRSIAQTLELLILTAKDNATMVACDSQS